MFSKVLCRVPLFGVINFMVVTLCWVFFRARTVGVAVSYLKGMFTYGKGVTLLGLNDVELWLCVLLIAILMMREYRYRKHLIRSNAGFAAYCAVMVTVCYFLGVFGENQFIYFQF
jgi:hypothetical protein